MQKASGLRHIKHIKKELKFISEILQEQEDKIILLSNENSALSDENATLKARIMELKRYTVI